MASSRPPIQLAQFAPAEPRPSTTPSRLTPAIGARSKRRPGSPGPPSSGATSRSATAGCHARR